MKPNQEVTGKNYNALVKRLNKLEKEIKILKRKVK